MAALALVAVVVTTAVTTAFAGSFLGHLIFAGSGLAGGLAAAWAIARRTASPPSLLGGAVLVSAASLATTLTVILTIFAVTGAGD